MKSHFFEEGEKSVLELSIAALRLPDRWAGLAVRAGNGGGFVEGAKESQLLFGRSGRKILAEESFALLVDIGEAAQKIAALIVVGPFGEDDVDKFVYAGFLGARRLGGRNNLIDHGDDRIVLMGVLSAARVPERAMWIART